MVFDRDNIMLVEFVTYDGLVFQSEEKLMEYINGCDCEYETQNFMLDRYDHLENMTEEELRGDMTEEELEDMFDEFEHQVNVLLENYSISYRKGNYDSYTLCGTFGNMKAFAKEYDPHLDLSNPGDALSDVEQEADIDIDSGNEDLIVFRLTD